MFVIATVFFPSRPFQLSLMLEPTRVKQFSGSLLEGRLLALLTNVRLSWKTNTLAYYKHSKIMDIKCYNDET